MSLERDLDIKYFYIIDIRFKQRYINLLENINIKNDFEALSLTPYSSFLLDNLEIKYITYHDIVSKDEFYKKIFLEYSLIESFFSKYRDLSFIFRDIATIKSFELYLYYLYIFLEDKKKIPID